MEENDHLVAVEMRTVSLQTPDSNDAGDHLSGLPLLSRFQVDCWCVTRSVVA